MVLVVLIISVAMMFAILSSFIPFSNAYWNIVQYSSAYYEAISAIERWSLAIRYAGPGFDWHSWWKYDRNSASWYNNTWHSSDFWISDFVSYWNAWQTTLYWDVVSRTKSVPKNWEWNVDPAFISDGGPYDYNALNYNSPVLIPLWYVPTITAASYYSWNWEYEVDSNYGWLSWTFRLNPYLEKKICGWNRQSCNVADLCRNTCPWSTDDTMDKWTPIVDWTIRWLYWVNNTEVSILPSDGSDISSSYYVHTSRDSVIRKCNIDGQSSYPSHCSDNRHKALLFWNNKSPTYSATTNVELNIMSSKSKELKDNGWTFNSVVKSLNSPYVTFELVNNLWSVWSWYSTMAHHLYPFLEYRIDVLSWEISDIFYTIKWEWKVWKYDVRLQVKKPTIRNSSLWNFTILF